jgi:hypothetical protein
VVCRSARCGTATKAHIPTARALWVIGFEEHLELNAVGILERQHRAILALSDRGVNYAELLKPCEPLVEFGPLVDFEPHVVDAGTKRIEGLALITVMLLELDDCP